MPGVHKIKEIVFDHKNKKVIIKGNPQKLCNSDANNPDNIVEDQYHIEKVRKEDGSTIVVLSDRELTPEETIRKTSDVYMDFLSARCSSAFIQS